ncbi:MAG: cell division protein ZapA [Calditrichaeota bacterium]|nr:cell division protein ZapA [Calditrichota bacterium]
MNNKELMNRADHNGDETVSVTIFGQEYPIRASGDVDYIRNVARFVDERMTLVEEQTAIRTPARIAILAALNIADELFTLRREKDRILSEFEEKARELSEALNQGINNL